MDKGNMHPPEYARDQSDADLDAMLAGAEDRLLTAIQASLDLGAGLAEIIGDPPPPGAARGDDELAAAARPPRASSAEDRYLAGPGNPSYLHAVTLQTQKAAAAARARAARHAVERAESVDAERKGRHAGGSHSGLIRVVLPALVLAEAVVAFMAMQVLVHGQALVAVLALLMALAGAGIAWILASRRLRQLTIRAAVRILEGLFVAAISVLSYENVRIQQHGSLTAAGAAAAAAAGSALALGGIEVIAAKTRPFSIVFSTLRVSWQRRRYAVASKRLAAIHARAEEARDQLQRDFLSFLLKTAGLPFGLARLRAEAILETTAASDNALAVDERSGTDPGQHRSRALVSLAVAAVVVTAAATAAIGLLSAPQPADPTAALTEPFPITLQDPPQAAGLSLPSNVLFGFNSAELPSSADTVLRVVAQLARSRHLAVSITGFASPDGGTAAYNHALSVQRAMAVRDRLIALGLPAAQITHVIGVGAPGQPSDACRTAGRLDEATCAELRRVVILLSPATGNQ